MSRRRFWIGALLVLGAGILGTVGVSTLRHRGRRRPRNVVRRVAPPAPRLVTPSLEDDLAASARLESAVERSGGRHVWVKPWRKGRPATVEVLATAEAFPTALQAISIEATKCGLKTEVERVKQSGKEGAARIDLRRNGQVVATWQVRTVPRILQAAIVIDDLGQNIEVARELATLPYPLTFSVLPHLPHSTETAQTAHSDGREVMLHLPMEPEPGSPERPGPGVILVGMQDGQVAGVVRVDLASVPYARGVNNHMGSRATSDGALMAEVMKVLASRRLFFVDSRTTPLTVAQDAARQAGVPNFARSVFLDDAESARYTLRQLRKFCQVVDRHGAALAIGHPYPTTIVALREFLPQFERHDIQLVPASRLVSRSGGKGQSPSVAAGSSPGSSQ